MKPAVFLLLFLSLALPAALATGAAIQNHQQPPADFEFVFTYSPCFTDELDTARGLFTYGGAQPPLTVPLVLSEDERARIYQRLMAIGFFSYPQTYRVETSPHQVTAMTIPYNTWRLQVRLGGRSHQVFWADQFIQPNPLRAQELRSLMRLILEVIYAHQEYRDLPEREILCL